MLAARAASIAAHASDAVTRGPPGSSSRAGQITATRRPRLVTATVAPARTMRRILPVSFLRSLEVTVSTVRSATGPSRFDESHFRPLRPAAGSVTRTEALVPCRGFGVGPGPCAAGPPRATIRETWRTGGSHGPRWRLDPCRALYSGGPLTDSRRSNVATRSLRPSADSSSPRIPRRRARSSPSPAFSMMQDASRMSRSLAASSL